MSQNELLPCGCGELEYVHIKVVAYIRKGIVGVVECQRCGEVVSFVSIGTAFPDEFTDDAYTAWNHRIAAAPASEAKGQPVVCACHTERERTLCRKRKECVVAYASGNQAAASSAADIVDAVDAPHGECPTCHQALHVEQEQAGELPELPAAFNYADCGKGKQLYTANQMHAYAHTALLRRAARVEVTDAMRKRTSEWLSTHGGYWDDDYVNRLLTAALEQKE